MVAGTISFYKSRELPLRITYVCGLQGLDGGLRQNSLSYQTCGPCSDRAVQTNTVLYTANLTAKLQVKAAANRRNGKARSASPSCLCSPFHPLLAITGHRSSVTHNMYPPSTESVDLFFQSVTLAGVFLFKLPESKPWIGQ